MPVLLGGTVIAGFGLAAESLAPVMNVLREKTGLALVEGTLNVRLDAPYIVLPDFVLEASEHRHHETLLLQRCRVGSVRGVILRTSTQARGESHPLDVIEILASANLRAFLGLKDDERVTVEVERSLE